VGVDGVRVKMMGGRSEEGGRRRSGEGGRGGIGGRGEGESEGKGEGGKIFFLCLITNPSYLRRINPPKRIDNIKKENGKWGCRFQALNQSWPVRDYE